MKLVFIFLMTLFLEYLGAVKFRCDYSYTKIGWFKYHEIPAKWGDARLRCRYEGAMLASPTTDLIRKEMLNITRVTDIFTGIHALSPGSYYSIDGKPLDSMIRKWAVNEPNNKEDRERCISLNYKGYFSDVNCHEPRPYICYRPDSTKDAGVCGTVDSEYQFEKRTNKCYKFHVNPRTYKRAHFVCSAEGGHLVVINSQMEATAIRELYAKYPWDKMSMYGSFFKDNALIGFHNYNESTDWTTVEGQTLQEAGYDQFGRGQPDVTIPGKFCGAVNRDGSLHNFWCEFPYAFICEKDPAYPPVCDTKEEQKP